MPNNTGGPAAPGGGGGGLGGVFDISQMATQTGQALLGNVVQGIFAGAQDRRMYRNAEKLQNLQIVGQKHMTDYNYAKQLQMWKDTNYSAQVEQLKLAGLNPGLLYGMSGGGGATTGSGGGTGPSGQTAYHPGHDATAMAQTMMGLALQKAQKENIEADTKVKVATAEKTAGVDTEIAKTQIASLTQGIQNQKAQERLTDVQTELAQLDTKYSRDTLEERIETTELLYHRALNTFEIEKRQNRLDEKQFNDKVNLLQNQVALAAAETYLKSEEAKNVSQDTINKVQELKNMIAHNLQQWDIVGIAKAHYGLEWQKFIEGLDDGNPLKGLLSNFLVGIPGLGRGTHKPVTGFKPK